MSGESDHSGIMYYNNVECLLCHLLWLVGSAALLKLRKESRQRRRKQKFALVTMMYQRGYSRQEVIDLFRFIEWVMMLPPELEQAFKKDLAYSSSCRAIATSIRPMWKQ